MKDYITNYLLWLTALGLYIYFAAAVRSVAVRLDMEDTWMAWVPLLNLYLFLRIAGPPGWWMLLGLVPFVNIAVFTFVTMVASEKTGRPPWWGLASLLPPAGLVLLGVIGFSVPARQRRESALRARRWQPE
ncbi:MAG: hypothetical protein C4534_03010 [Gaiellales bacterium]|nr:MAG: hypothetical protein C4534_03010 [Gaiellales bacterium]